MQFLKDFESGQELDLKGFSYLVSKVEFKGEVNFLIENILKVFYLFFSILT